MEQKERDAETIQIVDGARNPGAGHSERRRGWADLRRIRGRAAGELSGDGGYVRRHAGGGSGPPGPAIRAVPGTVWRAHSADSKGERKRVFAAPAAVAGAAAGRGRRLGVNAARKHARMMEMEAVRFYQRAADRVTHAGTRELLNKLADEERKHTETAENLEEKHLTEHARAREDASHKKLFLLQVVQPGLAGLMDGSVSTLAPLFAAAYASHKTWEAFLVGMAASVGAGISMGFAESLSDDGSLTGRGSPWIR